MAASCPVGGGGGGGGGATANSHKVLCEQISEKMFNLTFKYEQACRQIIQLAEANVALEKSLSHEIKEKVNLQSKLHFCETELEVTKARLEISRNFNKQMFERKLMAKANKVNSTADNSTDLGIGTSRTNTPMLISGVPNDNNDNDQHNLTTTSYTITGNTTKNLEHTILQNVPESPSVATTTSSLPATSQNDQVCIFVCLLKNLTIFLRVALV